ncbi:zinc finger protein 165 isoform X3 [Rhincodon typus]|uniref:zinc finger protein 165 isoform X3 n=1 Tax=Rhincodon typus TaxID=259920 RepID=UPI00202DD289|nr:zinc finger protein 165 isoform X3 [Rhincodon typus]
MKERGSETKKDSADVTEPSSSDNRGDRSDFCQNPEEPLTGVESNYLSQFVASVKEEQQASTVANLRAALLSKHNFLSVKSDQPGDDNPIIFEYLPKGPGNSLNHTEDEHDFQRRDLSPLTSQFPEQCLPRMLQCDEMLLKQMSHNPTDSPPQIKMDSTEGIITLSKYCEHSNSGLDVNFATDFLKGEDLKIGSSFIPDKVLKDFVFPLPTTNWHHEELTCRFCKLGFDSPEKHREHEYQHALIMLPVDTSGYVRPTLTTAGIHVFPGQALRYQCPRCPASFTLKSNAERHEKTVHCKRKNLHCSFCLKSFRDRTDLNRHVTSVHSCERAFVCSNCGKSFCIQKNLMNHIRICYQDSTQVYIELPDQHLVSDDLKIEEQLECYNDTPVLDSLQQLPSSQSSEIEFSE